LICATTPTTRFSGVIEKPITVKFFLAMLFGRITYVLVSEKSQKMSYFWHILADQSSQNERKDERS
jgi:hypothetical protein